MRLRVAVFGSTGSGDYGHQVDTGFANRDDTEICAVADADDAGRDKAMKRLSALRGYVDYGDLLREERPDIVVVAPRNPQSHFAMVTAALRAKCHVYCEKPLAVDLLEADSMVAIADQMGLRFAIALPFVHEARFRQIDDLLSAGSIGRITHLRAITKCDFRGGGQDLAVLGPHLFDMMRRFGGDPIVCTGQVRTDGRPSTREDVKLGDEGVGLIAGDAISGFFVFQNGITGTIESVRTDRKLAADQPYRLEIYGDEGVVVLRAPYGDHGLWRSSTPYAAAAGDAWEQLPTSEVPSQAAYHVLAANDLIAAIKERREPAATGRDGLWALEMSHAIYASHFAGSSVPLPLGDRSHPLRIEPNSRRPATSRRSSP